MPMHAITFPAAPAPLAADATPAQRAAYLTAANTHVVAAQAFALLATTVGGVSSLPATVPGEPAPEPDWAFWAGLMAKFDAAAATPLSGGFPQLPPTGATIAFDVDAELPIVQTLWAARKRALEPARAREVVFLNAAFAASA